MRWLGSLVCASLLMVVAAGAAPERQARVSAEPRAQSVKSAHQPSSRRQAETVAAGRVIEVHGRRVFTMRETEGNGRELLVIAPRPLSPGMAGATVRVQGTFRRISTAELKQSAVWSDVDERTRAGFAGRSALVATSLAAAREGEAETAAAAEPPAVEPPAEAPVLRAPLSVRVSTLAAHVDGLAGQELRVLNAHVVGVLQPNAFLIEPATSFLKGMGQRDRILVLVHRGRLQVPAELIVGSNVVVIGMARTLLGVRVTAEVPWPARLSPEVLDRLEIRGAVLATSVQTPEGTELLGPAAATR